MWTCIAGAPRKIDLTTAVRQAQSDSVSGTAALPTHAFEMPRENGPERQELTMAVAISWARRLDPARGLMHELTFSERGLSCFFLLGAERCRNM